MAASTLEFSHRPKRIEPGRSTVRREGIKHQDPLAGFRTVAGRGFEVFALDVEYDD